MTDQYVDPKSARASYRPKNVMSPGLQRARAPFRLRNALTGVALAGFAVGVWAYSIGAVKQDVFDDVDEEARALMAGSGIQKSEDGAPEGRGAADASTSISPPPAATMGMNPSTGTLVWGAPPVDNVGKMRDDKSGSRRVV
ncbi:hypothetical protein C8Q80DRAFT_1118954 [Daedaleopsis nitida]|nr:hypothetical protein C8Q80DRAFT_1118954 [Daedaleopsis nitida]